MDAADPTQAQFAAYRAMWDYFNVTLFGGALRRMFLNFSRRAKSLGFFAPERWRAARPARPGTPAVSASRSGSGRRDHDARLCETKMPRPSLAALRPARCQVRCLSGLVASGRSRRQRPWPRAVPCVPRRHDLAAVPHREMDVLLILRGHAFCSSLSGTGRATSWRRTKAARRWLEPADEPRSHDGEASHPPPEGIETTLP